MRTTITFFLILFTCACGLIKPASKLDNNADVNTTVDTLNKYYPDSTYVYKIDSSKTNDEYIDWSSVRINGKLPFITNIKDLYQLLGQPDSIVTPVYEDVSIAYFYNDKFKFAYFKDSEFEISGDSVVISYLNFEKQPGLVFNAGSLKLSHNTTLVELKKIFPKAVKSKEKSNVDKIGKCTGISVATSRYYNDDLWLLFFRKGRLIRIDYWIPD
jgi:hypothetical protein